MELRNSLRVPIQCHFSYAGTQSGQLVAGQGTVVNLSRDGMAIESPHQVEKGMTLALRIHLPESEVPTAIDEAEVLWTDGNKFGLKVVAIDDEDRGELCRAVVSNVNKISYHSSRFMVRLKS